MIISSDGTVAVYIIVSSGKSLVVSSLDMIIDCSGVFITIVIYNYKKILYIILSYQVMAPLHCSYCIIYIIYILS